MKKIFKSLIVAVASLLISSTAFAKDFDWSECWCNYGAGLKEGDIILNLGTSISYTHFESGFSSDSWNLPIVDFSLETPVKIGPCPFTFGGGFSWNNNGLKNNYDWGTIKTVYNVFDTYGVVKYHFMFPPTQLDLYAGTKAGISFSSARVVKSPENGNEESSINFGTGFYFNEFAGATWYFNKGFGVNAEIGFPVITSIGVTFKF